MAGNKEGPQAIARAFLQILKDHLPTRVAEILVERGSAPLSITAPVDPTGYAVSRLFAEDTINAICCYVDSESMIQEFHTINSPRRLNCVITVKIQYGDVVDDLGVEDPLNVITGASRFLIGKYWRAYFTETCLEKAEYISNQAAASLREQFRYEGWQNYGRPVENTNEQNEINFQCIQHVESAVSYSK